MTAAVDGIPLATAVAAALGVDIVVAKKNKEVGVQDFIEETYIPGDSAMVMSLNTTRICLEDCSTRGGLGYSQTDSILCSRDACIR